MEDLDQIAQSSLTRVPNSFDADVGSGDSRLERARYKYVRYNIISKLLSCVERSHDLGD